jgi:hypothetical protein
VLALDHMGWKEEHARGSSDKPSSVHVYIEIKTNGGAIRTFYVDKVKGEKGHEQIEFEIVGARLEDGQKTAIVQWADKWKDREAPGEALNGNAKMLLDCARDVINRTGEQRIFF